VPEPLIVVAGENLIDRIEHADGRVDEVPGGGPFTTARALARLGCRVAYLGRISTDDRGQRIRALLVEDGVDVSMTASTDDPTLVAHATLDATGSATYRFDWEQSAAAGLAPGDIPATLPNETVAVHVGTLGLVLEPIGSTIAGLVASLSPDVLLMVDPNIRPSVIVDEAAYRARLAPIVERADVIKCSEEDAAWIGVDDGLERDHGLGGSFRDRTLIVTAGPSAVVVRTSNASARFAVPPRHVVDTVGAGDVFSAGFLAAWVRAGRSRRDASDAAALAPAIRFGIAAAGWTVERVGADPPRPSDLGDDWSPGR